MVSAARVFLKFPFSALGVFHLFVALAVAFFTMRADPAENAVYWPIVYLSFSTLFFFLQWNALTAVVSDAYYLRPNSPARLEGVRALLTSHVWTWLFLLFFDWLLEQRSSQFMWRSLSYTLLVPLPPFITAMFIVRVLTARTRTSNAIVDNPLLNLLPFLFVYAYVLPSLGAAYLTYVNDEFLDAAIKPTPFVLYDCVDRQLQAQQVALALAVGWRNIAMAAAFLTVVVFYFAYARLSNYPRSPQVRFGLMIAPLVVLAYTSYRLATMLTHDQCSLVGDGAYWRALMSFRTFNWNVEGLVVGWVAAVPLIVIAVPFLMVTLHDPVKNQVRGPQRTTQQGHVAKLRERRERQRGDWEARWFWLNKTAALFWLRATRAQLMGWAIWKNNLATLLFALPISLLAGLRPLIIQTPSSEFDVVFIGVVGSSLVWLGVLINGLYSFQTTAQQAYESSLIDTVRRLNEHIIIVGYDDLGRLLANNWARRGLLGYESLHDHLLRGTNIILPDSRPARMFANLLIIDEPLQSGVGLVNVGPGIRGAVVSLTDSIQDLEQLIFNGERADPVVVTDPLRQWAQRGSRWLAAATRVFDLQVSRLVEYSVPLIAGDSSAREVREAAHFDRARFLVSAELASNKPDAGFVGVEEINALQVKRHTCLPTVIQVRSSALVSQLASRHVPFDTPIHVVPVDRLESSQATITLYSAIVKLWRSNKPQKVRAVIAMRGKKLFHLFDGLLALLEPEERRLFGDDKRRGDSIIVLVSEDNPISDLPYTEVESDRDDKERSEKPKWDDRFPDAERLATFRAQTNLKCRLVHYQPHVSRSVTNLKPPFVISPRVDIGLWILHIKADPRDYQTMTKVESFFKPNLVMVSDERMVAGLRSLNSIRLALTRRRSKPDVQILIAADRTRQHQRFYYWNALWYSAAFFRKPELGVRQRYPGLQDGYMDPTRDAMERVTGIWSAYSQLRGRRVSAAVELHACSANRPGTIADTLVRLCGGQADVHGIAGPGGRKCGVALLDTRMEMKSDGTFTLGALCELVLPQENETTIDYGRDRGWRGVRLAMHTTAEDQRQSVAEHVLSLLDKKRLRGDEVVAKTACARRSCCGMQSCPIEAVHKVVGSAGLAQEDQAKRDEVNDNIASRYWAADGRDPVWAEVPQLNGSYASPEKTEALSPQGPRAFITVKCDGALRRGTFAVSVASLLGWQVSTRRYGPGEAVGRKVVHLTYLSGSECHDNRFGLFSLYGFTQDDDQRPIGAVADIVKTVDIRPITRVKDWAAYEKGLADFLNGTNPERPFKRAFSEDGWDRITRDEVFLTKRKDLIKHPEGHAGQILDEQPLS